MKKIFPLLTVALLFSGCAAGSITKKQEQPNTSNIVSEEPVSLTPVEIDLNDITSPVDIKNSTQNLKLSRGNYVFSLSKVENLNNKEYYVYEKGNFSVDTKAHEADPGDAYLDNFAFVPTSDESAMRAIKFLEDEDISSGKVIDINTPEEMQAMQTIMNDTNHLNGAKFDAGILGANQSIKETAKKIKVGDIITISGQRYKHSKIELNGKEQPMTHCLSNMDMFYASKLEIK